VFSLSKSIRLAVTAGVLLGAEVLLHTVSHGESVVPLRPLHELSYVVGKWQGQEQTMPERLVRAVGVSDYVDRVYFASDEAPVQLYVGYYASQKSGDTIHSPKNCLPGTGWDPVYAGYRTIRVAAGRQITVNEYVIQQDQNKQLVFYWYQGRGRVNASEYAGKFWMIADAISRNRTDGALVRLITPMNDGESKARVRLVTFVQTLYTRLDEIIPK